MSREEIIKELEDWIEEYENVTKICETEKEIAEHSGSKEDVLIYDTQMYDYKEVSDDLKHFLMKALG